MNSTVFISPSDQFWTHCADHLIKMMQPGGAFNNTSLSAVDFSALRVIVPAFEHAQLLTTAMAEQLGTEFIPPRINTMSAWLAMQLPEQTDVLPISEGERLMALYAQLREHAWLKKLFTARRNTDLLPLAQTLMTLSDELTEAMLPLVMNEGMESVEQLWAQALGQMPAQQLLSDEAQMVWQIWKSQLDGQDAISYRFKRMLRLAQNATQPLLWISPTSPEALDQFFLTAYAQKNPVQIIGLDWHGPDLPDTLFAAWPEIRERDAIAVQPKNALGYITTIAADSLEQEAQLATQAILEWLQQGKSQIALIAQDRIVARRIRALLERANIFVADETGWKLSTTRAASALAAWFDVVATRADTVMLLDLLKSPYFDPVNDNEKSIWVIAIEMALRSANVDGSWEAIIATLKHSTHITLIEQLHKAAMHFAGRKSLSDWLNITRQTLDEFGVLTRWQTDVAGKQVVQLLEKLDIDCASLVDLFSFSEWRVFMNLQLESTAFQTEKIDQRVVMLPLNGVRLRSFDAVLMAGCDAAHLPSQPKEVLFFTNAVRRECGLTTREQRQRQQLRDFAAMLSSNSEIVLTWQHQQNGEDNPVSPWIGRLNLCLQQAGLSRLAKRNVQLTEQTLSLIKPQQPRPAAQKLQPATLSASGYNSFLACPYQFFATRMLGLSALDTLSNLPEKRDYGAWLHAILKTYHDNLKEKAETHSDIQLLSDISETVFADILKKSPAALGFYTRWKKVIPAYIAWSQKHFDAGWQFEMGEVWLEKNLEWEGGSIQLRGQIDRIDKNLANEFAVLDYKTSPVGVLKNKLNNAEDQQLPFYGLLADQPISSAHYVALEMAYEKISDVAAADYVNWQGQLKESIIQNMNAIEKGAELPAQGVSQVCQYCDVRGLCRKGDW